MRNKFTQKFTLDFKDVTREVYSIPSVYPHAWVRAWQCVSSAILVTVTPSTLPSLHVLYYRESNRESPNVFFLHFPLFFTISIIIYICFFFLLFPLFNSSQCFLCRWMLDTFNDYFKKAAVLRRLGSFFKMGCPFLAEASQAQ